MVIDFHLVCKCAGGVGVNVRVLFKWAPRVLVAAACLALAAGCEGRGNAFTPTNKFAEHLRQLAENLAREEMAKFNRIEETYKDVVSLDEQPNNEATTGGGVYYKKYRVFKRCEVLDVKRTDSYLKPIEMVVRFHYDLMGTTPRHTDFPDSASVASRDTTYEKLRERWITRRYRCDYTGRYDGALPEVPPPDNLYFPPERE